MGYGCLSSTSTAHRVQHLPAINVAMKRSVGALLKRRVAAQQRWHCNRCRSMLDEYYEVDHIVPLWANGRNARENLQALCVMCHRRKTYNENVARGPSGSSAKCTRCGRVYSLYFQHRRCRGP